ncbi:Ig-like domain-containing protein, partial [Cryobacterium sp. 10C2]|uniref:Ig-like domain-containing protein n=1 Tax=Cryobacterium sp. 10C2 TaxID=3048576 RepID=UPI002B23E46B
MCIRDSSGTRAANQEIQLLNPGEGDPLCIIEATPSTDWSCPANLPSGQNVRLKVVVTGDSSLTAEETIDVLGEPVVTGGPLGNPASNGTVRGSAYPGASVVATVSTGESCPATADTGGAWACTFPDLPSSGIHTVTAAQQTGFSAPSWSNDSAALSIRFDFDRPAAPVVSSPTAGARVAQTGSTYTGTGEDGATVTVFAGPYSLCTVAVAAGAWACTATGTVAAGNHLVIAAQQDAAGNQSQGSPGLGVDFGPAPDASPSATPPSSSPSAEAGSSSPTATAPASAPGTPSESATATPAPSATPTAVAPAPPGGGSSSGHDPALPGGWNDPTQFTSAVLPPGANADFSWLEAVLFAIGALVLLVIPARLLSGTIVRARDGRPLWNTAALSGRNQAREEFDKAPTVIVNRWLIAAASVAAAATLIMLSGTVSSQPAFLRLLLAVMLALIVVNTVGALVPQWWSSRVWGVPASVTFLPRYLLLVAVTALGSRAFEIHPALLFGLLGSVAVSSGHSAIHRGQLAALRAGSLLALALLGWLVLGILPTGADFGDLLAAEVANSVVLTAIGSALLVLIPIGSTSGRSIVAWSPLAWIGLTLAAFTIMFAVLNPVVGLWHGEGSVTLMWVASGLFAALSVSAWAWQRFVVPEPTL